MTPRAALYARYSSDQQRAASIEDQFRVCREHVEREGWTVASCYRDAAISGDSVILRPGIQTLLEDARRGLFEIGRLVWNRQRFVKNPETGRRVSRINPPEDWIVTGVPELRIVDDALWRAAKARPGELSEKYATVIAATREAHANRLNRTHRPRHLLSGLLECGVCGGPYDMRGQDRYGCSGTYRKNNRPIRVSKGAMSGQVGRGSVGASARRDLGDQPGHDV